ncbi:uncharacterized protein LOC144643445 isoform X3 [Oculina patagonica]
MSVMALRPGPEISRLKSSHPLAYSMFKYQHPIIFKKFVVNFVRSLTIDDRAAFKHWCIDLVPGSKLDVNVESDRPSFKLIEFLLCANELSFTNMSVLKEFLSSVGRFDFLKKLKRVELRISIGSILECYVLRKGSSDMKYFDCYANIVEFLLRTREENQELISPLLEQFLQVNDDGKALAVLDSVILDSQLSWSTVISSLVITGELYSSFSPDDLAENGFFVCLFSETKASEFLTGWILENGGLNLLMILRQIGKQKQD